MFPHLMEQGLGEPVNALFMYLRGLEYFDTPDYDFIRLKLEDIKVLAKKLETKKTADEASSVNSC